jgi:rhodanese-related sulfurtransferase
LFSAVCEWRTKVQSLEVVHIEDVPVEEVWAHLAKDAGSVLIDVRTRAEWTFVGLPDLSEIGKRVLTVEWQTCPESKVDAGFSERMTKALDAAGASKDNELFFICRSGARSRMAAEAMANVGYRRCRNVADGFEGPLDADRHRGQVAGWKAARLAWAQG